MTYNLTYYGISDSDGPIGVFGLVCWGGVETWNNICVWGGKDLKKDTAKRNISSATCASPMYSRLCMKMLSFLFVHAWAMPWILHLSCGIQFPVKIPGIISGLTSVVVWLSR